MLERLLGRHRLPPEAPTPITPLALDDAGFIQNPYPALRRLRDEQPLHRAANGAWVLSRHQDVMDALANPRLRNSPSRYAALHRRHAQRQLCAEIANNTLPFMDGEPHAQLRRVVAKSWIEHLRNSPPAVEAICLALLEKAVQKPTFDLLAEIATPLALRVTAELIGIPPADHHAWHQHAQAFFYLFASFPDAATRDRCNDQLNWLRSQALQLLRQRRAEPQADFASALLKATGGDCSDLLLADQLLLLFADGIENVDRGIASAVAAALQHPQQWQQLCAQPGLAHDATQEALRFESPALYIARIVDTPFECHGQTLKADEPVLLMLGSANRDERRFDEPDRFNIHRKSNPFVSFGRGLHSCIGAALARSEIETTLRVLASHQPQLKLCNRPLQWQARPAHRWLTALWVQA